MGPSLRVRSYNQGYFRGIGILVIAPLVTLVWETRLITRGAVAFLRHAGKFMLGQEVFHFSSELYD